MKKLTIAIIASILSINANSNSENKNVSGLIYHKEWHNVKLPKELINKKNYSDSNVTTDSEAYEASGFYNSNTLPKGNVYYNIKNTKNSGGLYMIDRWICMDNQFCSKFEDYIYISPSFSSEAFGELFTYVNTSSGIKLTTGIHESECVISISGDATSFNESTNKVTIN